MSAPTARGAVKPRAETPESAVPRGTSGLQRLRRAGTWSWQPLVLVLFIAEGTALFGGTDVYPLLVLAGIYGIAVIGVSLLAGLGGQLSLGHAAFIGIGAYASALATVRWGWSPAVGIVMGMAGSLLIALLTSPILRLRGWYLAMGTISLGFILQRVAVNLKETTGGNNGIYGIPGLTIGNFHVAGEKQYFVLAWTLVLVFFLLARNVASSRFGRAMQAIHKDEDAAATLAIPSFRYKTAIWLLAAVPPAIAGSLFAHYSAYIAPGDFSLATSLTLFVAVLLGGERSIFGSLVALVFLVCLPSFAGTGFFTTDMIKGLGLLLVYTISPTGLAGLVSAPLRRFSARRRRHA